MDYSKMRISEFSKVTGISRRNLLFYDQIGILSPAMRAEENNYRYYTYYQIDTANVITILREIGMSLKEIQKYLCGRTPEQLIYLLDEQKKVVQKRITVLNQIHDMLETRIHITQRGLKASASVDRIILKECESIPLLLGPELPMDSNSLDGWYYIVDFNEFCIKHHVIRGLPIGAIIAYSDLLKGNFAHPSWYYYQPVIHENNYPINAEKPRGLYVIGQEHTEYAQNENLYNRLCNYIKESGLKICGNAYEEYLFDEISTIDPTQYLLQVAIQVEKLKK